MEQTRKSIIEGLLRSALVVIVKCLVKTDLKINVYQDADEDSQVLRDSLLSLELAIMRVLRLIKEEQNEKTNNGIVFFSNN